VLASREALEAKMTEVTARFEGAEVPLPDWWGGFRVVPAQVELWQGRASRLHDRVRYTRADDGSWSRVRLSPWHLPDVWRRDRARSVVARCATRRSMSTPPANASPATRVAARADEVLLRGGAHQGVEAVIGAPARLPFAGVVAVHRDDGGALPALAEAGEGELKGGGGRMHGDGRGAQLVGQEAGDAVTQGVAGGEHGAGLAGAPRRTDPLGDTAKEAVHHPLFHPGGEVGGNEFKRAAGAD